MAQKKITFSTPRGVAAYPYITRADFEYNAEGIFKTKIKMSEADAAPLMTLIKETADQEFGAKAKQARMPFAKSDDTGQIEFTTKSKFKPLIVDSTGKTIPEGSAPTIYGGSIIKCQGTLYCYNAGGNLGVSLQLAGVQIVELAEGNNSVSFEPEEGGFVAAAANDNSEVQSGDGAAYNF
tara:strand:+ start:7054 stop:7593 length:540 start_codon:yes stop_codon:yes gene_type:complete